MKHLSLRLVNVLMLVGGVLLLTGCFGPNESKQNRSDVENALSNREEQLGKPVFGTVERNLGTLKRGEEAGARFGFKNVGEAPLVITKVQTGCGCTVAKYTQKPVMPGDSGFVEVIFDSTGKYGAQFQQVSVYFKGLKSPILLSLVAQVTN
ncbi:DUF1573 domain-containing protein [Thermophagus sp. OGC60D27]|uniref:DUF1573 domain-containing protein n=1 Tax=Thermophagus sp. OGC60D27 TaxID=3458415 RepID=UPI004037B785